MEDTLCRRIVSGVAQAFSARATIEDYWGIHGECTYKYTALKIANPTPKKKNTDTKLKYRVPTLYFFDLASELHVMAVKIPTTIRVSGKNIIHLDISKSQILPQWRYCASGIIALVI